VVLCVDEKPHIQALERAQGWIRLPNGRALTGFSHEYKRHGRTTLFAALGIATRLVHSGHYRRRRRSLIPPIPRAALPTEAGRSLSPRLSSLAASPLRPTRKQRECFNGLMRHETRSKSGL